jgi:hypothetical protein
MSVQTIKDWHGDTLRIESRIDDEQTVFIVDVTDEEGMASADLSIDAARQLVSFLNIGIKQAEAAQAERNVKRVPEGFEHGAVVRHVSAKNDRGILLRRHVRHAESSQAYAVWLVGWEHTDRIDKPLEEQIHSPRCGWHTEDSLALVRG